MAVLVLLKKKCPEASDHFQHLNVPNSSQESHSKKEYNSGYVSNHGVLHIDCGEMVAVKLQYVTMEIWSDNLYPIKHLEDEQHLKHGQP